MSFRWRYLDAAGTEVSGPLEAFDDQAQAEDWFSTEWPGLRERGVDAVTLLDVSCGAESEVYGPMSLHES